MRSGGPCGRGSLIRPGPRAEHGDVSLTDLTPTERSILDFERAWWQSPGPKCEGIRSELAMSPSSYYRRLDDLIDRPEVHDLDPLLVRRLRRARADRRRRRLVGSPISRRLR